MKLSDVIKIWDKLHKKDTGEIGFCDLEEEINNIVGVEDDISNGETYGKEELETNGNRMGKNDDALGGRKPEQ